MTKLFFVNGEETEVLDERGFDNEKLLQDMLERFPEVVALDDLDVKEPFMVIGREVRTEAGYIDVLCIDGDGVLTVIETKLARNAQIRREVIGQLLEYVAQLTRWSTGDVLEVYEKYHSERKLGEKGQPASLLDCMQPDTETDEPEDMSFYDKITKNLRDGVIKLVVASDSTPPVLKDTVTFINTYSKFDIYVLQIQAYIKGTMQFYAPSVFGHARKVYSDSRSERKQWTEESFIEALEHAAENVVRVVGNILKMTKNEADAVQWGTGKEEGSFSYSVQSPAKKINVFAVLGKEDNYRVIINFGSLKGFLPDPEATSFLDMLNQLPGVNIPPSSANEDKYPSFSVTSLSNETDLEAFTKGVRRLHALLKKPAR